jgi:hypothetical protein
MKPNGRRSAAIVVACFLILQPFRSQAQNSDSSKGYVGISIDDRETPDAPLRIRSVFSRSEAAKAGVKAPAYLLSVNGSNVTGAAKAEAIEMFRGPVGKAVEFETTDFDRQKTNKYVVNRGVLRIAKNVDSTRKSLVVTTDDIIVAKTPSGEAATIQFLNFSPSSDGVDEHIATATYRIRFAHQSGDITTNTLKESYSVQRLGKVTYDQLLTARADHFTDIQIGKTKLEWSYKSRNGGHLAFDTNLVSVTITNGGSFLESSK